MTKTAEKPYPMGRTYLYSPDKGVPPPTPREQAIKKSKQLSSNGNFNLCSTPGPTIQHEPLILFF